MGFMEHRPFPERIHEVAALDHPLTQAAYRLLIDRGELNRDETAEALDVARTVAAFHLDKLVDAGLADVRFERLTGRSGPGAGRTAKVYRRSDGELQVSLPERRYDLAGQLLAEAVERSALDGTPVEHALRDAAHHAGEELGAAARAEAGRRASRTARRNTLVAVLERQGYEPHVRDGEIVLVNCPFHLLADQHRGLVCGMNLDLLSGIIDGAGGGEVLSARLAPEPGYCCVRVAPR